jgi:hypothetical protein
VATGTNASCTWHRRLRDELLVPDGSRLAQSQLEDHLSVYLADVSKALQILDEGGAEPGLTIDGSEIQNVMANLHGAQRFRLGWSEAAIRREFDLLREEMRDAIDQAPGEHADARETATAIVRSLLDKSERACVTGFRRAPEGDGSVIPLAVRA